MFSPTSDALTAMKAGAAAIDVSIVMPCLDEAVSLPHCIANAQAALALIAARYGLGGEIVVADNGSTDGSRELAERLGARVVPVVSRGYGAAIIGGCTGAYGRWLLIGDADGSYDFTDGVAMIGRLIDGADLCMGSRFQGGIAPGAMPWKNRHIGNPLLTGILNLFFRAGVDDAHCGLRAITAETFARLGMRGQGMEFASEMVIKAALVGCRIEQVPATLSRDLRDRPPHLRPWRDGWRHLRFLMMLSPTWVFGVPALVATIAGAAILLHALLHLLGILTSAPVFGTSWTIVAGFLVTIGHFAGITAVTTHLHGVKAGYRRLRPVLKRYRKVLTLEATLVSGVGLVATSLAGLVAIGVYWSCASFAALPNTMPLVLAAVIGAVGMQTIFGGFLMAIVAGNEARFVPTLAFALPAMPPGVVPLPRQSAVA